VIAQIPLNLVTAALLAIVIALTIIALTVHVLNKPAEVEDWRVKRPNFFSIRKPNNHEHNLPRTSSNNSPSFSMGMRALPRTSQRSIGDGVERSCIDDRADRVVTTRTL
jgi:hypothetical protein